MPNVPFSKSLKKLREARGLSQTEMAAKIGIHASSLSRWEAGGSVPRKAWELTVKAYPELATTPPRFVTRTRKTAEPEASPPSPRARAAKPATPATVSKFAGFVDVMRDYTEIAARIEKLEAARETLLDDVVHVSRQIEQLRSDARRVMTTLVRAPY